MSNIIPFTDNYRDLSNDRGFQFEFVCDRCGNGYRSPFQSDAVAMGKNVLRGVGRFARGRLADLGYAADSFLDRSTNSPAKDKALATAVEAVRDEFRQCRGCGNWVCVPVCWNDEIGQCLVCSPSLTDELSRAQAQAQIEQIQEKARETDWTADLDITTRAVVVCPGCEARTEGGKFCPECGTSLAPTVACSNCGADVKAGANFCPECGTAV